MGNYLNPGNHGFSSIRNSRYIDKSGLIGLINETIDTSDKLTCISRPRRFGKSYAAKMLCAYYDRSCDSSALFDDLQIAAADSYRKHLNHYHVIYLDMTTMIGEAQATDLITYIRRCILNELTSTFPKTVLSDGLAAVLANAAEASGIRFIMIIDEWDAPIREYPENTREYLQFLRTLFKSSSMTDKIFAAVYMTGILPIKKDGSQSALSDFREYTMLAPGRFAPYIGFEEAEVKTLCDRHSMDFSEMQFWYDGYSFINTGSIYNPNSVMECISRGRFDSYWRQSSATDNLLYFINLDFDGLQKAVAQLLGGSDVEIDPSFFQNDIHILTSRDDALTLLVHLGYLSYNEDEKTVRIPNEEIRLEFAKMIRKVNHTETILRVKESDQLIEDTVLMKEDEVASRIEKIHREETAPLFYNNEQALRAVIKLAYFSYKDHYIKLEELPSGKGYADIVYLPKKNSMYPALLIELKAEGAIGQIREKNYPDVLRDYGGEVLLVGINYSRETKEHGCRIERLRL